MTWRIAGDSESVSHGAPGLGRVLLAWEHGANLGHLARLGAAEAVLVAAGQETCWAVPASRHADVARSSGLQSVRAAPALPALAGRGTPTSYADVLLQLGFSDENELAAAVRRWLVQMAPSAHAAAVKGVVLDYAPVATLAAMIAGLPAVQLTNGFDSPPPTCPPFGVGMRGPYIEKRNQQLVDQLDLAIRRVLSSFGCRGGLAELLDYPTRLLDTVAELDPYGPRADLIPVGPLGAPKGLASPVWPKVSGGVDRPQLLVYLRDPPAQVQVLQILDSLGCSVLGFCPGIPGALAAKLGPGIRLSAQPIDFSEALRHADGLVSYGSATLTCQALLARCPQVVIPTDIEKGMIAARMEQLEVGCVVRSERGLSAALSMLVRGELKVGETVSTLVSDHRSWRVPFDAVLLRSLGLIST